MEKAELVNKKVKSITSRNVSNLQGATPLGWVDMVFYIHTGGD